jgi:PAS domain S-box-containing protein
MSFDPNPKNTPLRANDERLEFALSAAGIGVWEWEVATGNLRWTETLERIFGFEPGSFPGTYEAYRSRIPAEDHPKMDVSLKRAIAEHRDHETEHRVRLPDGRIRWVQGRGRPYFDADGVFIRMIGTSFDVTEQKLAQDALQRTSEDLERIVSDRNDALSKSHAFLDSLIENLPLMVFVKDAKELRFVRFNKAGETLLGASRGSLLGKND